MPPPAVRFIADDKGAFVGALGMLFDASAFLDGPHSKRFVIITEDYRITHVIIEPNLCALTSDVWVGD
ncbi:hypothetical protein AcV5_001745 [Taiwanofungus camphoratus]|nr:hypothetical protein AcV5_001745 [Antrodia cinnamomea]